MLYKYKFFTALVIFLGCFDFVSFSLFLCFNQYIFCLKSDKISTKLPIRYVAFTISLHKSFCCIFFLFVYGTWAENPHEHVKIYRHHCNTSLKHWMELLCILNILHQLYEKPCYLQCLAMFHSKYESRQVMLEAGILLQQFSTHQMSISWMKICSNQKDEPTLFAWSEINLCFCGKFSCYFDHLLVKTLPMLIHVHSEEILTIGVTN